MIKLIVSDLDGTLLTRFKSVSPRNLAAITEAQNRGVYLSLATGRGLDSTKQFIPLLNLDKHQGYMIINNGQRVIDAATKKETVNGLIQIDEARAAFRFAKEHQLQMVLDGDEGLAFYSPEHLRIYRDIYLILIKLLPHFRPLLSRFHIFALFGFLKSQKVKILENEDDLNECYDKIGFTHFKHQLDASMESLVHIFEGKLEFMRVSDNWLDISPKGITKLYGIKQVQALLNIQDDEVLCLGDSENDVTMLSYYQHSVAMGNADPAIKALAKFTTLKNTEDGVAAAIERFVLNPTSTK